MRIVRDRYRPLAGHVQQMFGVGLEGADSAYGLEVADVPRDQRDAAGGETECVLQESANRQDRRHRPGQIDDDLNRINLR